MVSGDGDEEATRKPPRPQGRSCKGVLYMSSTRKANGRNPLCFGFSRSENQVHNYSAGKSEQDATKDGKALLDFKYACLGYSIHRDQQQTSSETGLDPRKHAELPFCVGIEMMAERRQRDGTNPARQEHIHQRDNQSSEAGPMISRPPSSIRPPSTVRGFPAEEFSTKFMRSAGLIASAMAKNLSRIANSIKGMADNIFDHDRSRPK